MKEAWREALAAAITAAREAAGMSKRALARRLDLPPTYVVQWEQGKGINDDNVLRVEVALDLDPGTLFVRAAESVRPLVLSFRQSACLTHWGADQRFSELIPAA